MADQNEDQFYISVESYLPQGLENDKKNVQIRPLSGERYPPATRVDCKRGLSENHPVGTKFKITVQMHDDNNGLGAYLAVPESFAYEVLHPPK